MVCPHHTFNTRETLKKERKHNNMFGVASASAVFTTLLASISTMLGTVLTAVLVIFAALLGLGLGIKYARKYIHGRKA
jgi:predicted membrane protein